MGRSRTSPVGSGHTRGGTCTCMLARIQGLGCEPRNHCKEREQMWPGRLWRRVRVRRRLMDRWPWRRWPSFSLPISLSRLPWIIQCINDPLQCKQRQAEAGPCAGQRQSQVAASGHVAPSWPWDPRLPGCRRSRPRPPTQQAGPAACICSAPSIAACRCRPGIPSAWIRIHRQIDARVVLLPPAGLCLPHDLVRFYYLLFRLAAAHQVQLVTF